MQLSLHFLCKVANSSTLTRTTMAEAKCRNKTGKFPGEQSEAWVSRESILLRALGDLFTDDTTLVEEVLSLIHSFKVAKAKGVPIHLAKVTGAGELRLDDGLISENTTAASTAASTACEDTQILHRHDKLCNGLSNVRTREQGNGLTHIDRKQTLSKQDELFRRCSNDHFTTSSRTSQTITNHHNIAQSAPMKEVFVSIQSVVCNNDFVGSSSNDSIYTTSSDSSGDSSIASGNSAGSFKTSTSVSSQLVPSAACSFGTDHRYTPDKISPQRPCLQPSHNREEQDKKASHPRSGNKNLDSPNRTATAFAKPINLLSITWHGISPKSSVLAPYSRPHRVHSPLCDDDDATNSSISSSDSETSTYSSSQSCPRSTRWHGDVPTMHDLGLRRPQRENTRHQRVDPRVA